MGDRVWTAFLQNKPSFFVHFLLYTFIDLSHLCLYTSSVVFLTWYCIIKSKERMNISVILRSESTRCLMNFSATSTDLKTTKGRKKTTESRDSNTFFVVFNKVN